MAIDMTFILKTVKGLPLKSKMSLVSPVWGGVPAGWVKPQPRIGLLNSIRRKFRNRLNKVQTRKKSINAKVIASVGVDSEREALLLSQLGRW